MSDDLTPMLGDWVASRASVKRRGESRSAERSRRSRAQQWHVGEVKDSRMQVHNHRYGLRWVDVADWVVVYRPRDSERAK